MGAMNLSVSKTTALEDGKDSGLILQTNNDKLSEKLEKFREVNRQTGEQEKEKSVIAESKLTFARGLINLCCDKLDITRAQLDSLSDGEIFDLHDKMMMSLPKMIKVNKCATLLASLVPSLLVVWGAIFFAPVLSMFLFITVAVALVSLGSYFSSWTREYLINKKFLESKFGKKDYFPMDILRKELRK